MGNEEILARKKNWAEILGLIGMILAILNMVTTLLGLIPLFGLVFMMLSSIVGGFLLALGIVSVIWARKKGQSIATIVLSAVSIAIAIPMWIIYLNALVQQIK